MLNFLFHDFQTISLQHLVQSLYFQPTNQMPVQSAYRHDRVRDPKGCYRTKPLHRPDEKRPTACCGPVCGTVPALVCSGISRVCRCRVFSHYKGMVWWDFSKTPIYYVFFLNPGTFFAGERILAVISWLCPHATTPACNVWESVGRGRLCGSSCWKCSFLCDN